MSALADFKYLCSSRQVEKGSMQCGHDFGESIHVHLLGLRGPPFVPPPP